MSTKAERNRYLRGIPQAQTVKGQAAFFVSIIIYKGGDTN